MSESYPPAISRGSTVSITQQIYRGMREAILSGSLAPGARLSSWQDLASQLGVSRGTVKRAYDLLKDEQLIITRGATGTWVTSSPPSLQTDPVETNTQQPGMFYDFRARPQYFQGGIPAQDEFPLKAWFNAWRKAMTADLSRPMIQPDPRGLYALRQEIAGYLTLARGLSCHADRVFISSGFSSGLFIVLSAMGFHGQKVFVEDPGFPRTRQALRELAITPVPVPVDPFGICVSPNMMNGEAKLAIVTPGQQSPLGMPLAPDRRMDLLNWARQTDAWIIEDDYAGELQLTGRAIPALAGDDHDGRVFHVGSFSKTINPSLRMGYLVVPEHLIGRFSKFVAHLTPAGSLIAQQALQYFIAGGHYLRHLRRMKTLYLARKTLLVSTLREELPPSVRCEFEGGLSVRLFFPTGTDDVAIAERAQLAGFGALPISPWYQGPNPQSGLLLSITNVTERSVAARCRALLRIIQGGI